MKQLVEQCVQKALTGIEGLDEITRGGFPRGRTTLIMGGPGCGKTVLALQTLVHGARNKEPGIFVTFEENCHQIVKNASTFGWNIPALQKQGSLFFLDARVSPASVSVGGFELTGMLAGLKAKASKMGARRIVFDSIDVLLALLNNPLAARQELFRIYDWLQECNLTGIITAKPDDPLQSHLHGYGFLQYLVDCVLVLQNRLLDHVSLREMRLAKYRGSGFSENEVPFAIGQSGIDVAGTGADEVAYKVFTDRISTGVKGLDDMLGGGYYRGTSILISGSPGTAKSTMAGAFLAAAARRGERGLFVSFDEAGSEIVRNLRSVGIRLSSGIRSGLLRMYSARTEVKSAEEHLLAIRLLIREHRPSCLVVDPLSAMIKAGGDLSAAGVVQRLLRLTKAQGITALSTSLLDEANGGVETTPIHISTMADTWLHVSYVINGGERNRALTIVKSRGTKHSNQVRELILSDRGVMLEEVYTAGGEVLMGTARWEKESLLRSEALRSQLEFRRKQQELASAEADIVARMTALKRELETCRAELALSAQAHEDRVLVAQRFREDLLKKRGGNGMRNVTRPVNGRSDRT